MRSIALAIAALLLLASCSGDPEPIEPGRTKPGRSVTPPAMPSAAQSKSPEGQVAFVRHVVEVLNYSVRSGSTEELERLFAPGCDGCGRYIARVNSDNADQGHVDGFNWNVSKGQVLNGDRVEASVNADAYRRTDPETGKLTRVEAASYHLGFKLESQDERWLVKELYVPESAQ